MDIYKLTNKNYKIFKKDYKTFFKQIENITLRCYECRFIPEFIINFENDELIIMSDCDSNDKIIDIVSYIKLILDTHLCQMCLSRNDLYFSINDNERTLICCGNCREKFKNEEFIIEPKRWNIRGHGRGRRPIYPYPPQRKDCQKNLEFISYNKIDKYCINHFKKYQYEDNLCEDCILMLRNPSNSKKIIELKNFILSEKEVENLKNDISYIENYIYGINFPQHFDNKRKEEKVILIYLYISFIKSLINTYEKMVHDNYLNYNIISNIRRIRIEKDKISNFLKENFAQMPFYNILIKKYFLSEKYQNEISDIYFQKYNANLIKRNEMLLDSSKNIENSYGTCIPSTWYTSKDNDILFCFTINDYNPITKIFDSNFNEFTQIKGFHYSQNPILNFLNYTFQVVEDYILIQNYKYSLPPDASAIEFYDCKKFYLKKILMHSDNITYKDYLIFYDFKNLNIYFLFINESKIVVIQIEKAKHFLIFISYFNLSLNKDAFIDFNIKSIDVSPIYDFRKNKNEYKFFDDKLYILSNNKELIEIELSTLFLEMRNIIVENDEILNFIDLDNENLLLLNSPKNSKEEKYLAFLNKNKFSIEKKINFTSEMRKYNNLEKLDENQINSGYDIWYYLPEEKNLIKINYIPKHYDFIKNGKFFRIKEKFISSNEKKDVNLWHWELYEIKKGSYFNINKIPKYDEFFSAFDYQLDTFPEPLQPIIYFKKYSLKNKILTCPYCPLIPSFKYKEKNEGGFFIKCIKCKIHGTFKIFDFYGYMAIYNDLNSAFCDFCGINNNLYFNTKELIYICKDCLNNLKYEKKDEIIDMNKICKCIKHNKDITYTFDKCEECLKEENINNPRDPNIPQIIIKRPPEKLENILFTKEEINELKEKVKIIENKIINEITKSYGLDHEYFDLYFFINFIDSLIYTYEYFSQKKCLNYNVVKNLRKIKFVPNYELPKVCKFNSDYLDSPDYIILDRNENSNELKMITPFCEFISMKRFLNGEINKEGEIYENMSKYDELYRLGEIYENVPESCDTYSDLYSLKVRKIQHDTKSNLNDFIKDNNHYKYEIRNSNFICLFESKKIQILSLKITKDQFLYKLHQIIKFNKAFKLLKACKGEYGRYVLVSNFIQENDGSKFYFLYKNGLIIISKNESHFQIDSIVSYDNAKFCGLDKYKYKLYILMNKKENDKNIYKVIEINLKNHKIKFYNINIECRFSFIFHNCIISSFAIIDKFILFNKEECHFQDDFIYIYDLNQEKIVNKFEKKDSFFEKLKKENEFIIVYCVASKKPWWGPTQYIYFSEYWKFENNQFIFLRRKKESPNLND